MEKINELLHRDMTRKEFLATIGLGLATVFGLSAILKVLTGKNLTTQQNNTYGYGNGTYGGPKQSA